MKFVIGLVLLLTVGHAQTLTQLEDLTNHIDSAEHEILVMAPSLSASEVAWSLHLASYERGINVFVIVDPDTATSPASYLSWLALHDTIHVRLAPVNDGFAIIDDEFALVGPLLYRSGSRFDDDDTFITDNLAASTNHFLDTWEQASPFDFIPQAFLRR